MNVPQPPHALTNNTLRYREEDIDESIVGYVRSSAGVLRKAPAFLIGTLDGNIISIGKARELDLEIMALEPGEGATFDFGTGRPERSIGKAVFEWKQSDNSIYAPLTVTCDVCENSAVGLVLGRPFIEARAGRTRRGSMYG